MENRGEAALQLLRAKMVGWSHTIGRAARVDVAIEPIVDGAFAVRISWPPAGVLTRSYAVADALSPVPSCTLTRQLIAAVLEARGI